MEKKIKVTGMHCSSCEFLIKDSLNDLGIKATADHKKNEVIIENFDPKKTDLEKVYKAIEENGYKAIR
ncbi:MAG: heavy-metal-associated domain-containing protein [Nanoarchaeota archaeon]